MSNNIDIKTLEAFQDGNHKALLIMKLVDC